MLATGSEFASILQRVWSKLQGLPQAAPLESGAFSILILFIGNLSHPVPFWSVTPPP
uniref:Uncharacterized protein n=1 Tax=Xiphophorus maculatus TaxID=8083 RepID=M4AYH2_XIPMA